MPKGLVTFIIALIVFAIAVQNTCPYGYAGKTAIAVSHVHKCPLKGHQPSRTEGQNKVEKDFQDLNHPLVLVSAPIDGTFMTFAPVRETGIIKPHGYKDIFLIPPHRPPES